MQGEDAACQTELDPTINFRQAMSGWLKREAKFTSSLVMGTPNPGAWESAAPFQNSRTKKPC